MLVGSTVIIHGLASRADLNGRKARVIGWDVAPGKRWVVEVERTGERVRIKQANLRSDPVASNERFDGRNLLPNSLFDAVHGGRDGGCPVSCLPRRHRGGFTEEYNSTSVLRRAYLRDLPCAVCQINCGCRKALSLVSCGVAAVG